MEIGNGGQKNGRHYSIFVTEFSKRNGKMNRIEFRFVVNAFNSHVHSAHFDCDFQFSEISLCVRLSSLVIAHWNNDTKDQ